MSLSLNTTATGFSLQNARALAAFSRLAYDQATITSAAETHALIQETDNAVIVAFRGTHHPQDFIVDGEAWRFQTDHYGVHWGFWNSICSLARDVNDSVLKLYGPKPLFITGHSLGGALAVLYAAHWSPSPRAVYTFGQPRVGDARFRDIYNSTLGSRTWRIVNEEDIVPRVPGALAGYRHVGHEVFLPALPGRASNLRIDPPLWYKLLSDTWGLYRANRRCAAELIHDHALDNYITRLATVSQAPEEQIAGSQANAAESAGPAPQFPPPRTTSATEVGRVTPCAPPQP